MFRPLSVRILLVVLLHAYFSALPGRVDGRMRLKDENIVRIENLITDLNHDEFKIRQSASQALQNIGSSAEPALREALDSQSPEVRVRAAAILEVFWRRKMPVATHTLEGQHQNTVTMVVFSPDGGSLASTSEDGTAVLWQWPGGKARQVLKGHASGVLLAAFSPDGKTLATGGRDAKVILWDVETGAVRTVINDHKAAVSAVLYSRDGKTLVTGSSDRSVKVRDSDGTLRFSLAGHQQDVIALTLSADAKRLVSAGGNWGNDAQDGEVKGWDLVARAESWSAVGKFGGIWGVDLSPDGHQLAGACLDGTVRMWDAASGQPQTTLAGHSGRVLWVAYAPGGRWLASASLDGTVGFWDITRQQVRPIGHLDALNVQRFAFSPSGRWLATAGSDHKVTIWKIPD